MAWWVRGTWVGDGGVVASVVVVCDGYGVGQGDDGDGGVSVVMEAMVAMVVMVVADMRMVMAAVITMPMSVHVSFCACTIHVNQHLCNCLTSTCSC